MESSTFSMPSIGRKLRVLAAVEPEFLSARRLKVATTSSAPKGLPSWNLTPWRSLKVHVLMSSDGVHEVASSGCGTPSALTRARKFRNGKTVMMPPLDVSLWGLISTAGEPVTRIVPPRRGSRPAAVGAAPADAGAAPADVGAAPADVGAAPADVGAAPADVGAAAAAVGASVAAGAPPAPLVVLSGVAGEHAARMALIAGADRPRVAAHRIKVRRLTRPARYSSARCPRYSCMN